MTIKEIHNAIKQIIPEAGCVQVQHTFIDNICGEHWSCLIYHKAATPEAELDNIMFMIHSKKSVDELLAEVAKAYDKCDPAGVKARRIIKLKHELEQLLKGEI